MGAYRRVARLVAPAILLATLFVCSTAGAATTEATVPFGPIVTTNPCNGDVVTFAGLSHSVTVLNGDQVTIQENWPDTSGVALDGTTYQVNDANHVFVRSFPAGAFTFVLSDSFELVSNDGSSNFLVHMGIEVSFPSGDTKVRGAGEECSGPTPAP